MKKITLKEESYNRLKKSLVNEISYGLVNKAYDRSERLFNDVIDSFKTFYETLEEAIIESKSSARHMDGELNPYLMKIKGLSEQINDILLKKEAQKDEFNDAVDSVDVNKFDDSEEGENNNIDDMDFRYLQNNYPS